jgi:DNA invertase Pin-like site-specific DNA recombinase
VIVEPVRIATYTRVSTLSQSVENQRHELHRVAAARHWLVAQEYTDDGISGAKDRSERPALNALLKAATRGEFEVLAVWSIDRLGRSLQHLVETVNELKAVGVDLYIHQQALDTSTPAGKLAFSVFGALAEYERALIGERVRAGLDRARRNGVRLGRPSNLNDSTRAAIVALRAKEFQLGRLPRNCESELGPSIRCSRQRDRESPHAKCERPARP